MAGPRIRYFTAYLLESIINFTMEITPMVTSVDESMSR